MSLFIFSTNGRSLHLRNLFSPHFRLWGLCILNHSRNSILFNPMSKPSSFQRKEDGSWWDQHYWYCTVTNINIKNWGRSQRKDEGLSKVNCPSLLSIVKSLHTVYWNYERHQKYRKHGAGSLQWLEQCVISWTKWTSICRVYSWD